MSLAEQEQNDKKAGRYMDLPFLGKDIEEEAWNSLEKPRNSLEET